MPLEKNRQFERRKQKSEYPVLGRALSGSPGALDVLKRICEGEELRSYETQLNTTWDAKLIPKLLAKVEAEENTVDQKMAA